MPTSVTIGRPGQFEQYERECRRALERAALSAADRAAKLAVRGVRDGMRGAGLGRLSNAVSAGSDKAKGRGVTRTGAGWSASGWVYVRGKSERTKGAIEAYTEGATIRGRRSKWLWIATPEIPQRAGRKKMTPELYRASGLESRIGPLVQIPGRDKREALLIVNDVSVDRFRAGRARRLPKRGGLRPSRAKVAHIVAFVGIRRTSRQARTNPEAAIRAAVARLPDLLAEETRKEF